MSGAEGEFSSLIGAAPKASTAMSVAPRLLQLCGVPGCGFSTHSKGGMTRHGIVHRAQTEGAPRRTPFSRVAVECDVSGCSFSCSSQNALRAHRITVHHGLGADEPGAAVSSAGLHVCQVPGCGYSTAQGGHFKLHTFTHTGEKPFKCSYPSCEYAASQRGLLTLHQYKHSGGKPIPCTAAGCVWRANTQGELRKHMAKKHGAEGLGGGDS